MIEVVAKPVVTRLEQPAMCSMVWVEDGVAVACANVAYSLVDVPDGAIAVMCTECCRQLAETEPAYAAALPQALADAEHPSDGPLNRLAVARPCATSWLDVNGTRDWCEKPATWAVGDTAICHECMDEAADLNDSNREYFMIPLAEAEQEAGKEVADGQ